MSYKNTNIWQRLVKHYEQFQPTHYARLVKSGEHNAYFDALTEGVYARIETRTNELVEIVPLVEYQAMSFMQRLTLMNTCIAQAQSEIMTDELAAEEEGLRDYKLDEFGCYID